MGSFQRQLKLDTRPALLLALFRFKAPPPSGSPANSLRPLTVVLRVIGMGHVYELVAVLELKRMILQQS